MSEPRVPPLEWMAGVTDPGVPGDGWGPDAASSPLTYWHWREQRRLATPARRERPVTGRAPTLSVVVPVHRTEHGRLGDSVRSVTGQTSPDWELWLCDTGSNGAPLSHVLSTVLDGPVETETRIHVLPSRAGGVLDGINQALATVTGQFAVVVEAGDVLEATAVEEVTRFLAVEGDVDVLYSDEDRFLDIEYPVQPHFKPDWDPDLLLSTAYLGRGLVVRTALLRSIGGYRAEFEGAHEHDLMLRATESAGRIAHLPVVLYHRRIDDGRSLSAEASESEDRMGRRAVRAALERRGIDGRVEAGPFRGAHHVRRAIAGSPTVSVIIPFRDQAALTVACLNSLGRAPGHAIDEIVLIDNGSSDPETRALRRRLQGRSSLRILDYPEPFNWAAINNVAAATCDTDMLLFMNNDIEATSTHWLQALVEVAQRPEVGAVAPRLVYPDGSVQHAGVVLGLGGIAMHLFSGLPAGRTGYFGWDRLVRGYSALTGACLLVRRQVFEEVGGFDEALPVAFNDVDFCIRLGQDGYRLVYTPHSELTHYESVSRGRSGFSTDFATFLSRWWDHLQRDDPAYNPNLGRFAPWCPVRMPGEDERWLAEVGAAVPDRHGR